jgi:putative flippase GtrA
MKEKLLGLYKKYEEVANYLVVGVLTTIVSWGAAWVATWVLNPNVSWQNAVINTISWAAGVIFGYFANRKYVFKSTNPEMLKEFMSFAGGRVSTWLLDVLIMEVTVNLLKLPYWPCKIFISSVLVMAANYLLSKLFVFRKK